LIQLFTIEILDEKIRENFRRLIAFFRDDPWQKGNFKFLELTLASDVTVGYPATLTVPHRLGFVPKDVVQTGTFPSTSTVTWNFESFTRTTLSVTISAAVVVRAYVGRYGET
jgi:hypothetical protein